MRLLNLSEPPYLKGLLGSTGHMHNKRIHLEPGVTSHVTVQVQTRGNTTIGSPITNQWGKNTVNKHIMQTRTRVRGIQK